MGREAFEHETEIEIDVVEALEHDTDIEVDVIVASYSTVYDEDRNSSEMIIQIRRMARSL